MGTIDVEAWQRRLKRTFNEAGIVGPRLADVISMEAAYGDYVREHMTGYGTLADSFESFFYDTLVKALNQYVDKNATKDAPYQPMYFLGQLTVFRSIRAAENLLYLGYPLDGMSLLRDIKDRAVFFAAWISGLTTYYALNALDLLPKEDDLSVEASRTWRGARGKEENRILQLMLRMASGFEESIKRGLQKWEDFFNFEVHGSHFTMAAEFGGWMRGTEPLSIAPVPKDRSAAGYMNRAAEVFWMVHRTLPFLQLSQGAFGQSWAEKWFVLDDSFRLYQRSFEELGKPIATAVRVFIERKFPFTPATIYIERDQTAASVTG